MCVCVRACVYICCACMYMYKFIYWYSCALAVCSDIRKHEDGWVFVDPVTDDIAPGYSDVIKVRLLFD